MRHSKQLNLVLAVAFILVLFTAVSSSAFTNLALTATASAYSEQGGFGAALAKDGNMGTRWSQAPGSDAGQWYFMYEWSTPQTIHGFIDHEYNAAWCPFYSADYWDGSSWVSLGDFPGARLPNLPIVWAFDSPITTTKLRINGPVTSWEIQVADEPMLKGIEGRVYRDDNSNPIPGVTVTCSGQSSVTGPDGRYQLLGLPPGPAIVTISKGLIQGQQDVTVPADGMVTADFPVNDPNIAPLAMPSSTSVESTSTGPALAIDEDYTNRMVFDWTTNEGGMPNDPVRSFTLFWSEPKTFNNLVLRQWDGCCQTGTIKIEVWDPTLNDGAGDFKEVMIATGIPRVASLNIPTQTTQALRISDPALTVIMELEVFNFATVTGIVSDSNDKPIWGATVIGGILPAVTDINGAYSIQAIPGPATINVSRFPFNNASVSVTVPVEGLTQNITLTGGAANLALSASVSASFSNEGHPPLNANDGDPETRWTADEQAPAGAARLTTYTLEWATPQTIDTVYIPDTVTAAVVVYAWRNDAWQKVIKVGDELNGMPLPIVVQFTPVLTTKLRTVWVYDTNEIEVYHVGGAAPIDNLSGTIRNEFSKQGLANALITVGETSTFSNEKGNYSLSVAEGAAAVSVSRAPYTPDPATLSVTAPASNVDFGLTSYNIAPYGTASSSSYFGGNPIPFGNDNDISTRYSVMPGDSTLEYFLEWAYPVTINEVKVHAWRTDFMPGPMEVYSWDGSTWAHQATVPVANTMDATFAPVTTTKIKLHNTVTFHECEAFGTINVDSVAAARQLAGAKVSFSGSTTAVFSDAGYIEDTSRACGIRIEPSTGFGAQDVSASVVGILGMSDLEKCIFASSVTSGGASAVDPVGMPNKSLSVEDANLSTVGILVTTWGNVVRTEPAAGGAKYLYVDDGSLVPSDLTGVYALKVGPVVTTKDTGNYVRVTGISRIIDVGGIPVRTLQPRSSADVN